MVNAYVFIDEKTEPKPPKTEGLPKWLQKDVFVYRDKFPAVYEHPPHPRQMPIAHTLTAKFRNFPWRFYWRYNWFLRYFVYFNPPVLYFLYKLYSPLFSRETREKMHHAHLETEKKEKRWSGYKQRHADQKHFGWTKGEFD